MHACSCLLAKLTSAPEVNVQRWATWHGLWESNSGPLQEQRVPSTADSSLQPLFLMAQQSRRHNVELLMEPVVLVIILYSWFMWSKRLPYHLHLHEIESGLADCRAVVGLFCCCHCYSFIGGGQDLPLWPSVALDRLYVCTTWLRAYLLFSKNRKGVWGCSQWAKCFCGMHEARIDPQNYTNGMWWHIFLGTPNLKGRKKQEDLQSSLSVTRWVPDQPKKLNPVPNKQANNKNKKLKIHTGHRWYNGSHWRSYPPDGEKDDLGHYLIKVIIDFGKQKRSFSSEW